MPVVLVRRALLIPVPLNVSPQSVDVGGEFTLLDIVFGHILSGDEQSLHKERSLYQIASVVFLAERLHLAVGVPEPVREGTVESVGGG